MPFTLTSPVLADGKPVPVRHTCDGENLSPPLAWTDPPGGTAAFALVMDDPDAPGGTFTHWLLCNLSPATSGLEEGYRPGQTGTSGANDFAKIGYGGPCPPRGHGPHRYRFRLLALGRKLDLPAGYARAAFDVAASGSVLGTAAIVATYERRR